ncbi:MAG: hypothetical protein KGJ37_05795 [Verrucomicrobiota bacterium]|nr:hypothetical protein [Verrucomicrobiota bacterium]
MKTSICLALALLAAMPARAQIFGPNASGGALLGGLAGGIIGYNNHNQTGRGIAIGAASGLLLGSFVDQANYNSYHATQVPVPGNYYVYRGPAYSSPAYYDTDYAYTRPNYTASGTLLGGLAGGIIGYNNHHQTGRGILIGAASGWLLGSIAEQAAREREAAVTPVVVMTAPDPQNTAPQAAPAPANAPPTPPAPVSAMSSANSLFGRN